MMKKNLKRAFLAPSIWRIEAGHLARLERLPACKIKRAPTISPIREVKLGAMSFIFVTRYSYSFFLYSERSMTLWANCWTLIKSIGDKSCPEKGKRRYKWNLLFIWLVTFEQPICTYKGKQFYVLPMDALAASTTSFALSSSPRMSDNRGICSSDRSDLFGTSFATLAYK